MGDGWSTSRPGRFIPGIRIDANCIGGWVGLKATWIRSPDRPARSESPYQLLKHGEDLCLIFLCEKRNGNDTVLVSLQEDELPLGSTEGTS